MITIKKFNLLTGETGSEETIFSGDNLEMTLIAFLEQNLNNNHNTWNYENSKFKTQLVKSKNSDKVLYYMINDDLGYMAKLSK